MGQSETGPFGLDLIPNRGVEGAFIPQLSFSDVYNRLGECLRRFLRQIMSDAACVFETSPHPKSSPWSARLHVPLRLVCLVRLLAEPIRHFFDRYRPDQAG
jgi:hypothetical protein